MSTSKSLLQKLLLGGDVQLLDVQQLGQGGVAFDEPLKGGRFVETLFIEQLVVAVVELEDLVGQGVGQSRGRWSPPRRGLNTSSVAVTTSSLVSPS